MNGDTDKIHYSICPVQPTVLSADLVLIHGRRGKLLEYCKIRKD